MSKRKEIWYGYVHEKSYGECFLDMGAQTVAFSVLPKEFAGSRVKVTIEELRELGAEDSIMSKVQELLVGVPA